MEWTIKQISKKTGLPTDTLRYYDKLGVVSPTRKANGYRYYDEQDFIYLQYVVVMKYSQFSLNEIKSVISTLRDTPSNECNSINRNLLLCKRTEMTEMIEIYKNIIKFIDTVLEMVADTDAFIQNEVKLDTFIGGIYNSIREIKSSTKSMEVE